MTSRGKLTHR